MPLFDSADAFYATVGALCQRIATDEVIGPQLASLDMVLRMDFDKPVATVVFDCREEPALVTFGADGLTGDLTLKMSADNGHRLWLGELSAMTGVATRKIKAKGDLMKAMGLAPVLEIAEPIYREVLTDAGRTDLIAG